MVSYPGNGGVQEEGGGGMGKGKGALDHWVAVVKPGRILCEIDGLNFEEAQEAFRKCANKLPLKAKMVPRREL